MAATHKSYLRTHWVTLVTLVVFAAMVFAVRWIVKTQRSPGSITVVEAQGMDMAAMKAPPGVQPVASEPVSYRSVGGQTSFSATVMAYSDEEVVARVPGRVLRLAYPGDRVLAGQVVAQIDAAEYLAQAGQARFAAKSGNAQAIAAKRDIERRKAMRTQSAGGVDSAYATLAKARADRTASVAEQRQKQVEADSKAALVKDREAEALYAKQDEERKNKLYGEGFISLNDYQVAKARRDSAEARVESAKLDANAALHSSQAASARVLASDEEIRQAQAQVKVAQSAVVSADKDVQMASAQEEAAIAQARAMTNQANSASDIAGYTELRALDSAMVAERFVSPGSVVTMGQKLLMLHDASRVRVQAQLPQSLATIAIDGTPVVIHYGKTVLQGKLTSIFPTADPSTRTFTAEALIANPNHEFLPGSFATLSVQTGEDEAGLAVKSSAIQTNASGTRFVWVITHLREGAKTDWTCPMHTEVSEPGPGKCPICKMELVPRSRGGKTIATRRNITVGQSGADYTAIVSGLTKGDEIIWAGFETLVEGSPVKSVPWGKEGPETLPGIGDSPPTSPSTPGMRMGKPSSAGGKAAPASKRQLFTCSMHPEVVQDHPGKCPKCGMDLIPKKADH